MVSIVLLSGLVLAGIATGLVFADTVKRDLPARSRYLWTAGVGVVSVAGFWLAYRYGEVLHRSYLGARGSAATVPVPREVAVTFLVVGLGASGAAVVAYGFGSRFGPLRAPERTGDVFDP